jgi:hypothetical protein
MRKDQWMKWMVGGGIGSLVLGAALFAQRGSDIFSFEHFRAPQFLLRDPSTEDRPIVEVVSSPVVEKNNETYGVNASGEAAPEVLPFRLQSDLEARPVVGVRGQNLPSRLSLDRFRESNWEVPSWVPFYRDRHIPELRLPVGAPVPDLQVISPNDLESKKEVSPAEVMAEDQSFPALTFSDSSQGMVGLRPATTLSSTTGNGESKESLPIRFRASELLPLDPQTGERGWVHSSMGKDRQSIVPEGTAFKGREAEAYASDQAGENGALSSKKESKVDLIKTSEDEQSELLAKQKQEAKDLEKRVLDDRRFQTVADRDILFSEDGRGRLYAPGYRVGEFDVNMDLMNRYSYNTNYRFDKNKQSAGSIATTPTVEFAAGERDPEITDALYMAFRYTPSLVNYLDVDEKPLLNQEGAFNAGYRFSKLSLNLDQRMSGFAGADVVVGGFNTRDFYTTSASMEYELSEKTSFELSGSMAIRDYRDAGTFDSEEPFLKSYVNYALSEKVRLGLGAGAGMLVTSGGSDQTYQDALVRGVYFFSPKSTVFAESGVEQRQFDGGGVKDQNDGIFKAGGNLALFPKTSLEMDASRRQIASGTREGVNVKSTGFTVSIIQEVEKLRLVFGGGYSFNEDIQNVPDTVAHSQIKAKGNTMTLRLGARYPITDWWDVGLDYSHWSTQADTVDSKNLVRVKSEINAGEVGVNSKVRF